MAGKRLFQDLESEEKKTEKRKSPPSFASVVGALITENTMKTFSSALEPLFRNVVRQEVEHGINKRLRSFSRSSSFRVEAPETPTLKLMFRKNLMTPIFTGSKIGDVDNNPLEIILVDGSNKIAPVTLDRPIRLDIVALHGDFPSGDDKWSSDEFERNIVKERDGKRPLLAGEVTVTVRNGVGVIGHLEFTDNSSWIRSRKFRIGVKVSKGSSGQGVAVCEAMTEAFVVKDHRGELYKKHHPPMLDDEVWRLEKIGKDGAFHKRLSSANINTVQDFLKLSVVDLDKLRQIIGMSDKMWDVTFKHASECNLGNELYIHRGPGYSYNEISLSTEGDNTLDKQYGANHYQNIEINRSYQQNGYVPAERSTNNLEIINEGYITTPMEFGICFNITGSSSQNHLNPFENPHLR
uniref:Protein SAR DEFICIENT 1 n=1 Tax=Noccaea caerulescens TaxID=107243 RepID=A0A1J3HSN9_NOCCA